MRISDWSSDVCSSDLLALLGDINRKLGLTIVLITHEMSVIRDLCDRVVVLESGRVVEEGAVIDVFVRPRSPVTRSLLQAVLPQLPDDLAARLSPVPGPDRQRSEERRVGKEGVSTCSVRWPPYP